MGEIKQLNVHAWLKKINYLKNSLENNIRAILETTEPEGVKERRPESWNMTEKAIQMLKSILDETHCSCPTPLQSNCKPKITAVNFHYTFTSSHRSEDQTCVQHSKHLHIFSRD